MRVLVTGGSGFIGQYVLARLPTAGHIGILYDRRAEAPRRNGLILGDIRDRAAVHEAMAHADGVIHLAGVLGTQETIAEPHVAAETNVLGMLNVLDAARAFDMPVVNIGVGNHWMANTYAISKTCAERFCEMYRREHGLRVSTVRAMNAYGPGQAAAHPYGPSKVRKIMPAFICRALAREPIEIYGDGKQVMDMIYVGDVASVLVATLNHTAEYGGVQRVLEVGTGRRTTVQEIAEMVIDAVGYGEIKYLPMRPGEDEHAEVVADPETLRPLGLDYVPLKLEDGVAVTVESYRR